MQGEVPAESMPQVFHVRVIDTRDQQERLADVRSQQGLASNPVSRRAVWSLVTKAWPLLEIKFKDSVHLGKIAQFASQS